MIKKLLIVLGICLVGWMVLAQGCASTPAERVEGLSQFIGLASETGGEALVTTNAILDDTIAKCDEALADTSISAKNKESYTELRDKTIELRSAVGKGEAAKDVLEAWGIKLKEIAQQEDIQFGHELLAWAAGIQAASTLAPPPFNLYGSIVSLVVGGIGGSLISRKKTVK